MYRYNIGCGGLLGTILFICIIVAIVASPLTWAIVGAIILYMIITRTIRGRQNAEDAETYYTEDRDQGYSYTSAENVNPYSYRESIPEQTPFTEDEFNTNAVDVDVEVEPVDVQ